MLMRALLAVALMLPAVPASAQFYKGKTLTLLVNYGVGGNADTEARIYQHYLPRYIAGNPTVITRNVPGAGGAAAINQLGLNIASQPDGLTVGYFTTSATTSLTDDPSLRVKLYDFNAIGASGGFNVVYARRDIVPGGMSQPADIAKARNVYAGGYARSTSHDTRLRLALEILGLPYAMVTGFPGTAQINKAMLQNEVNFSGSSLPGYNTQVIPQIIKPGVGMTVFQFPAIGPDGTPVGDPVLERAGIQTFDKVYAQAFGKPPTGRKFDALLLMNDISTKLQRLVAAAQGLAAGGGRGAAQGLQCARAGQGFRRGLYAGHRRGARPGQGGSDRAVVPAHAPSRSGDRADPEGVDRGVSARALSGTPASPSDNAWPSAAGISPSWRG